MWISHGGADRTKVAKTEPSCRYVIQKRWPAGEGTSPLGSSGIDHQGGNFLEENEVRLCKNESPTSGRLWLRGPFQKSLS